MFSKTAPSLTEQQRIETVKRHIQCHITEPLDRTQLATLAGFSVPHFHRVFLEHVGESPVAYIRRLRLERAGRKLLLNLCKCRGTAPVPPPDSLRR